MSTKILVYFCQKHDFLEKKIFFYPKNNFLTYFFEQKKIYMGVKKIIKKSMFLTLFLIRSKESLCDHHEKKHSESEETDVEIHLDYKEIEFAKMSNLFLEKFPENRSKFSYFDFFLSVHTENEISISQSDVSYLEFSMDKYFLTSEYFFTSLNILKNFFEVYVKNIKID